MVQTVRRVFVGALSLVREWCVKCSLCAADSMKEWLSRETEQAELRLLVWDKEERLRTSENVKEPRLFNGRVSTKTFESSCACLSTEVVLLASFMF